MGQPSGFVPVPFRRTGMVLLTLGLIGVIVFGGLRMVGWLELPPAIMIVSAALLPIGLYLIFVGRSQDEQ